MTNLVKKEEMDTKDQEVRINAAIQSYGAQINYLSNQLAGTVAELASAQAKIKQLEKQIKDEQDAKKVPNSDSTGS